LSSGEFLQVLVIGLVLLVLGAGYRMYMGIAQEKRDDRNLAWVRERAAKEADAQIARGQAVTVAALTPSNSGSKPTINP
jgi:hypothetical protein